MAEPTTTDEAIEQLALGPKSVTVGNQSVTQHSADDLIKLDQYQTAKRSAAAGVTGFGLRFQKIIPPGAG
jgi:hypothetical protein